MQEIATAGFFHVTAYAVVNVIVLYPTMREEMTEDGELRFAGLCGRVPVRILVLGVPVTRMLQDEVTGPSLFAPGPGPATQLVPAVARRRAAPSSPAA